MHNSIQGRLLKQLHIVSGGTDSSAEPGKTIEVKRLGFGADLGPSSSRDPNNIGIGLKTTENNSVRNK